MNHTSLLEEASEDKCDCDETFSIPFLDTLCSIKNGKIDTDLYKNQQIETSRSCHSIVNHKGYPLFLRSPNKKVI